MKKALALILALLIVLSLSMGSALAEGNKYAIVVKNTGNPYNDKEAEGFTNGCKDIGAEAIVNAPANPTAEDQIAMIEAADRPEGQRHRHRRQ